MVAHGEQFVGKRLRVPWDWVDEKGEMEHGDDDAYYTEVTGYIHNTNQSLCRWVFRDPEDCEVHMDLKSLLDFIIEHVDEEESAGNEEVSIVKYDTEVLIALDF